MRERISLSVMTRCALGSDNLDTYDFKEMDCLLSYNVRICRDGIQGIAGLLMEIGLNVEKGPGDDPISSETIFAVGELIDGLIGLMKTCQNYKEKNLKAMVAAEQEDKREGGVR